MQNAYSLAKHVSPSREHHLPSSHKTHTPTQNVYSRSRIVLSRKTHNVHSHAKHVLSGKTRTLRQNAYSHTQNAFSHAKRIACILRKKCILTEEAYSHAKRVLSRKTCKSLTRVSPTFFTQNTYSHAKRLTCILMQNRFSHTRGVLSCKTRTLTQNAYSHAKHISLSGVHHLPSSRKMSTLRQNS